ncbi:hypothetical protein GCM10028798_15100 [Humibacter antri]
MAAGSVSSGSVFSGSVASGRASGGLRPVSLTDDDLADIDRRLGATDELLTKEYPGDDGSRQPVHTVYVPADRFTPELPAQWGAQAADAVAAFGDTVALASAVGLGELAASVAPLVEKKLRTEPIEDLRLDFEDGYGDRGDETEDADARACAERVAAAVAAGTAPPFVGIRFKSFEAPTRRRGLRTLDLFVTTLAEAGELPDGLVLTLPKVTTVAQVEAMADVCERLERKLGLSDGRLRFEVQMETPQLIIAADGTVPVATLLHSTSRSGDSRSGGSSSGASAGGAGGRVSALHYGTYDYSASLQIAAAYQSMEHPAADFAKNVMQVAAAETGVRLSDGSTNVIPVGDRDHVLDAWRLHARLVRRSLEHGFFQGWDLNAAQLPTRFLATYAFYREGLAAATRRLHNYLHAGDTAIMDEPATARALARYVVRGLECGAVTPAEVEHAAGATPAELTRLAHPKLATLQETT